MSNGIHSSEVQIVLQTDDIPITEAKIPPFQMRRLIEERGFQYPSRNIIFHCLKGGASKTTLAYNCAFRLSQLGTRVLLVDLDRQANSTYIFFTKQPENVFVDVVTGQCPIEKAIFPVFPFLDILPSSLDNARLEMELINGKKNPRNFYRNLFGPIRNRYDVVILDLPPDLNHNTYLSSLFADTIVIPTTPDEFSLYGMKLTLSSLEGMQQEYGELQQDVLIVWSKFDPREKSAFHHIAELKDINGARVFPIVIRTDVSIKHAQEKGKSIFQLNRKSSAKDDIDCLARELVGMREFFSPQGNA
ncbi:MAG: ParA family protein [Deltaproteobacteria bacterium]|nr:ParA family protein [Deltaproteobacteria bacterium]